MIGVTWLPNINFGSSEVLNLTPTRILNYLYRCSTH